MNVEEIGAIRSERIFTHSFAKLFLPPLFVAWHPTQPPDPNRQMGERFHWPPCLVLGFQRTASEGETSSSGQQDDRGTEHKGFCRALMRTPRISAKEGGRLLEDYEDAFSLFSLCPRREFGSGVSDSICPIRQVSNALSLSHRDSVWVVPIVRIDEHGNQTEVSRL